LIMKTTIYAKVKLRACGAFLILIILIM